MDRNRSRSRNNQRSGNRNRKTRDSVQKDLAMMVGTCRLERNPLNFKPIGVKKVYHFLRRTTTITSYTATSGSFVTNGSTSYFQQNTAATPLDAFVALAFQLNDLPDYTEFTNLFDQYCLLGVQVRITPRINSGGAQGPCTLYALLDSSDITLPSSLQQFRESQTMKEFSTTTLTNRRWTVKHSPRIAAAAYAGAFSGYSAPSMTWIDVQSPNVQHYGIKFATPAGVSGSSNQLTYDMDFKYHIVCRMAQ